MTLSRLLIALVLCGLLCISVLDTSLAGHGYGSGSDSTERAPSEGEKSWIAEHPLKPEAKLTATSPIAIVNGSAISKAELDMAYQAHMNRFRRQAMNTHRNVKSGNRQMRDDVIEQLVERELLYQESLNYPVEKMEERVGEELAMVKGRFPNEASFKSAISQVGMDEARFKVFLEKQVSVRNYIAVHIKPTVKLAEGEVAGFYEENKEQFSTPEQVRCSHILVRKRDGASAEEDKGTKAKAEKIRARCLAGEDFEELVKEHSEDSASAEKGGDMGFYRRDTLLKPLADAAFALDVGEFSQVVETRYGYHVIKLTEHIDAGQQSLGTVRERIGSFLKARAVEEEVRAKVSEMKESAEIQVVAAHYDHSQ